MNNTYFRERVSDYKRQQIYDFLRLKYNDIYFPFTGFDGGAKMSIRSPTYIGLHSRIHFINVTYRYLMYKIIEELYTEKMTHE
jgi:hypothetical protein